MIVIDMDMPKNCVECHKKGIQELLECRLIFSGCANCGRHPNCPIKCDIEDIEADIAEYRDNFVCAGRGNIASAVENCIRIIDKYKAEMESEDKE